MRKKLYDKERSNKGRRFPPEPLRPEELDALAQRCNPRYPSGARNRALILVLGHSGVRSAEAVALLPKDLELDRGRLRVLHGKGDKHRLVPVSGAAAAALVRWFEHRKKLRIPDSAPLFSTAKGKPLATAYLRALVKRLARRVGIAKRVHPHGLRHSFAFESIRRGVRINTLAKVLGHSSSAVTARYVDHLGDDAAVESVREAWNDRKQPPTFVAPPVRVPNPTAAPASPATRRRTSRK